MSPDELGLVAKHVMKLLVERRYDELEEVTGGTRLSADAIADAVDDIGAPLVMPPPSSWSTLHVMAVRNWPGAFSLHMDLWTARPLAAVRSAQWSLPFTTRTASH